MSSSSQPGNEKRPRLSSLGTQGLFKRSKDKAKHKGAKNKEKKQGDEKVKDKPAPDVRHGEPSVEPGQLEQGTKRRRPPSWRFSFPGAMFAKSQFGTSERVVPKQPSFSTRNSGCLEKKAALSTILSALSKKQSQEKDFQDNSRDKMSRQVSLPTRWSSSAATGMPAQAKPQQPRRPMSEFIGKSRSMFDSASRFSSDLGDQTKASTSSSTSVVTQKSTVVHEKPAPMSGRAPSSYGGHSKMHTSENEPPILFSSNTPSLGSRRIDAPSELPDTVVPASTQELSNDVVLVSPSCVSRKRLSSGTDSVTVSTAFQVQGQPTTPTTTRAGPNCSDPWSSSVSVCVPFEVTEDQEVRALPLSASPTRSRPVGSNFSALTAHLPDDSKPSRSELVQAKPTARPETEPSNKESILSRNFRQGPKISTVNPETGAPKADGMRKADETDGGLGAKARSQFSATKPVHARDDDSANGKATKDAKKPNKIGAKAKSDGSTKQTSKGGQTEVKQKTRSLSVHRDKLQSADNLEKLSPRNNPRSRSVNSSPKPSRALDNKSRNAAKPNAVDSKDHVKRGRPQSDPLIGDKLESATSRKAPPSLSQVGKTQAVDKATEEETQSKLKLQHCEEEKSEIQERAKAMELQLSMLPLLEREKLQLQRRLNDMTQELDKAKSDVVSLKANAETNVQEKKALVSRHEKLLVQFEEGQGDLEETRDKKELLEEEKQHLLEENEKNLKEFDIYLDKIEKLTNENATRMLEQGRLRGKLSTVENSLRALKDCAMKMREENSSLRASVVDFRHVIGCTIPNSVKEFEAVVERMKVTRKVDIEDSVVISEESDPVDDEKETLLEELEINKRCVQTLLRRINELENEKSEHEEGRYVSTEKLDKSRESVEAVDSGASLAGVWEECCDLRERLESLQVSYDSQTRRLEELENEKEELKEERKGLEYETKYLKNVLSYRENTKKVQVDHKTNRQMEQMEENLGAAESKVKGLEDELERLHTEKKTLLTSILNLNAEQAMQAEEDFDDDDDDDDYDDDDDDEDDDEVDDETSESETESEEEGEASSGKGDVKYKARRTGGIKNAAKSPSSDGDSKASRREKYNFRRALSSMSTESEYSGFSFRDEDDEDSSLEIETSEEGLRHLRELVKKLKEENRLLQNRMDEVTGEREEVLQQFDKLCDDYDSLESRLDRLEDENQENSEQLKSEKRTMKARVKDLEKAREGLEESLKEVQDEKLALLKCLEMRSAEEEERGERPPSPLPMSAMEEIIARAQAFSQEEEKEKDSKREDVSAQDSSSEDENEAKAARRLHVEKEQRTAPEGRPDVAPRVERDDELVRIVASIETDLGKLKEKLYRNTNAVDDKPQVRVREERSESDPPQSPSIRVETNLESEPEKLESESEKTESEAEKQTDDSSCAQSPAERFLKRQASSVKTNLERVYREKQHLEGEIETLRQCFSRSLRRGSVATIQRKQSVAGRKMSVVAMADNQVEAIRTLQELLQRADSELKDSNAKISRLEEKNAEADEKLKESELLQSDLRQAVVISHNYASEENERAKMALEERRELAREITRLKHDKKQPNQGSTEPAPSLGKRKAYVKGRSMSDDSSYLAESESAFTQDEGESDFYSSRHSSMASESDLIRSPPPEGTEEHDEWPRQPGNTNGNLVEDQTNPGIEITGDTSEEDSVSRTSSTYSGTE